MIAFITGIFIVLITFILGYILGLSFNKSNRPKCQCKTGSTNIVSNIHEPKKPM